jgi:hypothetical protein
MPWWTIATVEVLAAATPHRRWEDGNLHRLSQHQLHALKITSLVASIFSVAAAFVTLYWFIHMRRSFRHE